MREENIFDRVEKKKRFFRGRSTPYIQLNTHKCEACWDCIDACPEEVIGKVGFWFHKHAAIVNPEACTGCAKCVKACDYGALSRVKKKVPDQEGSKF